MKKTICCLLIIVILIMMSSLFYCVGAVEDDGMIYMDNYGVRTNDYVPNYPTYTNNPQSSVNLSKYDPRINNNTTPVKNQGPLGTCAIFATTACFEMSSYMQTGLKYQYSEEAVRFALSNRLLKANDIDEQTSDGFYKNDSSAAWNFAEVTSYFSNINNPIIKGNAINWVSPNLLADVPYTTNEVVPTGYWPDNMDITNANAFVSGTEYVREDLIRDKILQYGAVYTTFLCEPIDDPDSYNSNTYSWYSLTNDMNHAVVVVGWDDNYSRYNFNSNRIPPGDGAWLVKNSWGTDYGDNGYCWISYYDESFNNGNQAAVVTSVEPLSKNEYMLSYDYMPLTNLYGIEEKYCSNTVYTCNVYDISEYNNEFNYIDKVMFYSNCIGGTFEIYIVPINSDGLLPSVSDLGVMRASGNVTKDGYITAKLQNPYLITSNNKIAVVVKNTKNSYVFIPREGSDTDADGFCADIESNESYFSIGGDWYDVTDTLNSDTFGNYCIRPILRRATPITQDSSLSTYSIYNQGEAFSVTVDFNGNQLYSIKRGTTVLYEDIAFTRNDNVITFKETFMDGLSTNKTHNITFSFTDGADQVLQILPRELTTVIMNGKVAQGQTLTINITSNNGTELPSQQLMYQWQYSDDGSTWSNIGGANLSSYTLTAAERLKYIRCKVTVSSGNGVASATKYTSATATKVVLYGDVNLNGIVENIDATIVQRYTSNMQTLTQEQLIAADVDGNGIVEPFDATHIQRYVSGIISSFPVE